MTTEMNENAAGGDAPLDELINLLGDAEPHVRAQARRQLCARAEEAIPKLVEAIEGVSEDIRFEISKTLAETGPAGLTVMMKAIEHPNAHVRSIAARVLSLVGGEDAKRRLDEIAETEKRKTVRKELREASAKIGRRLERLRVGVPGVLPSESAELRKRDRLSEREREEKKLYFSIVRNLIVSNWAKPRVSTEGVEAEEVLVTVKVERDGSVSRVLIENKWQNSPLGESLKDAIRRSAPFPPVPEVVAHEKDEIDITFILTVPS